MSPLSPAFPKADFLLVILMRFSSMFHVSRATPTQSSTSARTTSDFMISPAYRRTNSKKIGSVVVKISTTSMVRRKRCSESKCLPWSGRQRDHRNLNRCHIFVRSSSELVPSPPFYPVGSLSRVFQSSAFSTSR